VRTTLAALATLIATLGAAGAAAPPLVDWHAAGDHTGRVVTIEGDVRSARCAEDSCTLAFAPDDSMGFRVVVLMPMFSRAAEQPDRAYTGRRIRATGKVQRFQGRVEMVVRGTSQIELADVGSTTSTVAVPSTQPAPPPLTIPPPALAPRGAPPVPAPAVVTPTTLVPARPPTPTMPPDSSPPTPPPAHVEMAPPPASPEERQADVPATPEPSCDQAKARWKQIAGDVRADTAALERCFRALPYHCRAETAALAALLPALDEAERQADEACR
jgi:hypothetical protein